MFDQIAALISSKAAMKPLLVRVWEEVMDLLGPISIRSTILAYYFSEHGTYCNLVLLTPELIVDLETNESTQRLGYSVHWLSTVGGVVISNNPDHLSDPISDVARGQSKLASLKGGILTHEGDESITWFASGDEEVDLRAFIRRVCTSRFG